MLIDFDNCQQGNRALASVLLLYYHLLLEGGFTHDQTVYLEPDTFNGFDFLDVEVAEGQRSEISEQLLREGAVVYLLCDLNDMVTDYEHDYLSQPQVRKMVSAYAEGKLLAVPEASAVFELLLRGEANLDYERYQSSLSSIFHSYVAAKIQALLPRSDA
jgi:hypothetical protein